MRHSPRLPSLAAAALVAAGTSCARPASTIPLTERARPASAYNARLGTGAPPVAATLDARRIGRARAEPQNWLTYHGTYDGQRFSALDQIDTANVASLRTAWVFQTGAVGLVASPATYALEGTPLVVDGVMFLSGFDGNVWALDAATGDLLWHYQYAVPLDVPLCCGNVNRGVAVARGKVFYATPNGHLLALDAASGRVVWDRVFLDVRAGESSTGAPLVVGDLVIAGSAGAEYGVRGHLDAFDLETGHTRWRRYTVPKPGEPGSESWPAGSDAWARGGGSTWVTGTYDPELDLLYWGIANPGPLFDGAPRAGADLYTNSIIALRPADGSIAWYFQISPHDQWDYDAVSEPILFDQGGRRLLAQFNKNGYLYILDRTTGRPVRVARFARATWADVDSLTGVPAVRLTPSATGTHICPGPAGAKEWNHATYDPRTGLLYAPVLEMCGTFTSRSREFREGVPYWGGSAVPDSTDRWGEVKAIDPSTGRQVWAWRGTHPMVASLLSTGGGLVFAGEPTGEILALDARTGAVRWRLQTGSGIHGSIMTYAVRGRQYVAVTTGWGGWVKGIAPELSAAPRGGALFVFALP
ncbi:MAG TPA: PQQ-dependent dehydrogenase, methanol/ethanol family [Gemmatimonadaceae bacterium]|nr:PQQ-dependent dehydrogenase, methanol/ethanol family [Gemmatimonadaceae bacterium]